MSGESTIDTLEQLYARRYGHFVGMAEWVVGNRSTAEGMVQDVFVRLVAEPPSLRDPESLEAYVRRAVMNRCKSSLRRVNLERRHASTHRERSQVDSYVDEPVRLAVGQLPIRQRQCVVLRFYDDLTVDQVGHALGMRSGTVKSHLHRAMRSLGDTLKEGP